MDCFAGSGTTLKAAEKLGRQWIGIDQSSLAINAIKNKLQIGSNDLFSQANECQIIELNG